MIKGTRLKEEMKGTTRIFGRKDEIEVAFAGREAKVDGDVVVLPDIEGADIEPRLASVMRGFVDHHSGVARYSDTALLKFTQGKSAEIGTIMQAIEDPRIDKKRIEDYVGSRQHISDAVDSMCDAFIEGTKDTDFDSPDLDYRSYVPMAIATLGREHIGLTANTAVMRSHLPSKAVECFEKYGDDIGKTNTTLDSLKLSVRIAKDLGIKIPPELAKKAGGGGGHGEGPAGDESGGGGEAVEDGDTTAGPGDEVDMINPFLGSGINRDIPPAKSDGKYKEFFDQDVHVYINDIVARGWGSWEASEASKKVFADRYGGRYLQHICGEHPHKDGVRKYNDLMSEAKKVVGVTRIKLESMLFSQLDRSWEGAKLDGRLDQRRLSAAFTGTPTVFKHRSAVNEIDAAVMLLVDLSGSMSGDKERIAAECALTISESLNKLKVPFAVFGFATVFDRSIRSLKDVPADIRSSVGPSVVAQMVDHGRLQIGGGGRSMRLKPTTIYHFKDFNNSYQDTRPAIAQLTDAAGGDNHDAAGLYHAYRALLKRHERKRVLMVLSDGQPCCSGVPASAQLPIMVDRIENIDKAVELLAIGIQTDAPRQYYKNATVVHRLADLPKVALTELGKRLK